MLFGCGFAEIGMLFIGMDSGSIILRRCRRLEPGILGRQAFWVVLGWGLGAVLAMAGVLFLASRASN